MNYIKIVPLIIALFHGSTLVAQDYLLYQQTNETNNLIFEEKGEMPIALSTSLSTEGLGSFNIQMGYSPLKYLNFSGAYFKSLQRTDTIVEREHSSYTFSLGTNYKITWTGTDVKGRHPNRKKIEVEKCLNFLLNIGYSVNSMKLNRLMPEFEKPIHSRSIRYNSLFIKLGFSHEYGWGRWGVSGQLNSNYYKGLNFIGNWETGNYFQQVDNYFEGKKFIQIASLSLHNEIGKKALKLIFGGNFVFFESFSPDHSTYPSSLPVTVYIGINIDLSKLKRFIIKKKKE